MIAITVMYLVLGLVIGDTRAVAARVNGEAVYGAEVEAELQRAHRSRKLEEGERKQLWRAALDQLIDRRLVVAYLIKTGQAASGQDVDLALAQFEKDLKAQNLTLAQHCEQIGLTLDDIRRALTWKISWQRYLDKQLTDANLEKYFDRYRREFDGTELRVAQILLKLPSDAGEEAVKVEMNRAAQLKEEIASGKIKFADAAKQHSQAPSAADGGNIGWIERHKPMPDYFSRRAYALKPDEVSEPFVSPFGVHLITVLEEKPGSKGWREVEGELRPAVAVYLFRWIAEKERAGAKIEYVE
jgi:parvulin-like peptidyl-prolyl isomerase